MNNLEKRIGELEKRTGVDKQQIVIIVQYKGQPDPSESQMEAAIAEYKERNPDWKEEYYIALHWKGDHFEFPSPQQKVETVRT